jgi:hypothetical protein
MYKIKTFRQIEIIHISSIINANNINKYEGFISVKPGKPHHPGIV